MDNNTVPVRVNVPNPDLNSAQPRVTAVTNPDGKTAHTAAGATVPIVTKVGTLKRDVIVHGNKPL